MRLRLLSLALLLLILAPWALVVADGNQTSRLPKGPKLSPPATAISKLKLRRNAIVRAVQRVRGAVVNIHSERTVHGPATSDLFTLPPSQNRVNGMGTGILIDPRGYIVTNQHVVEDVSIIRVRLADGTTTNATVLDRDRLVDLALLKINTTKALPTMPLGTAADLMVGEDVFAIGNAFGYEHTVSRGIVSAVKRDVRLNKEISYKALIQTDASINPGNSGGPLINIHGELVGVNVAIRAGAQGIGFAIPVDSMITVIGGMLRNQRSRNVSEGLTVCNAMQKSPDGVVRHVQIRSIVKGGPAQKSGLRQGDRLLKIAGVPIRCSYDVDRALLGRRSGARVSFVVERGGKKITSSVVLKNGAANGPAATELVWAKLGMKLKSITRDRINRVNRKLNGGLVVKSIRTGGLAQRAGIRIGDILVGLHRWETLTPDNIAFVLQHPDLPSFNPLEFYIIRDGDVRRGWLQRVD